MNNGSDLSPLCAAALAALAREAGADPTAHGGRVRIGRDEVHLLTHIENEVEADGKHFIGMAVGAVINGVSRPLTVGSVGIGLTREEAVETAVFEWVQLVGTALLSALGVPMYKMKRLSAGAFFAYPGRPGVRGVEPGGWPPEHLRQLLDRLIAVIDRLGAASDEFRVISIAVAIEKGSVQRGECTVDGRPSQEALAAMKAIEWPRTDDGYMFKQVFVLRPR